MKQNFLRVTSAFFLAIFALCLMGSGIAPSAYNLVENAGTPVTRRSTLNFVSGTTCVDNAGTQATDCTSAGGGGGSTTNYSQSFTTQTTVALTHNLNTTAVLTNCYDGSNVEIIPATTTITDANTVTVTFSIAQTGKCVVNGTGTPSSNLFGTYASLPATATVGSRYTTSDSPYEFVGVTGPAWQALFRGQAVTVPAPASGWTTINGGGTTTDDTKGVITVSGPAAIGAFNATLLVKTAPATPYTATSLMSAQWPIEVGGLWDAMSGLAFRESGSGKFITVQFGNRSDRSGPFELRVVTWNNATTPVANVAAFSLTSPINWVWLRAGDDSTNRFGDYSTDGITWNRFYSEARTTFITADQIGFFGNANVSGGTSPTYNFTIASWTLQ